MVTHWSTEPKITGSRPVVCVLLLFFKKKKFNIFVKLKIIEKYFQILNSTLFYFFYKKYYWLHTNNFSIRGKTFNLFDL